MQCVYAPVTKVLCVIFRRRLVSDVGPGTLPVVVVEDGRLSGREKGHFCSFVLSCVSVVTSNLLLL